MEHDMVDAGHVQLGSSHWYPFQAGRCMHAILWRGQYRRSAASGLARASQDHVALFSAHRRSDWPEIVGGGDSRQFVHGRERWSARHNTRRGWNAEVADEVTEAGVVVHQQDPRLVVTYHSEGVGHASGHGDPMPGSDD